jgi:CrcB protein
VIALGGGTGSVARYALGDLFPTSAGTLPWITLAINVLGSFLLGMLVVAVTEIWRPHHLLRPLLGTGVLGEFTTFSTFAVQARTLGFGTSATYVALSIGGAVAAAALGMTLVRQLEPRVRIAATHELVDPIDPDLP